MVISQIDVFICGDIYCNDLPKGSKRTDGEKGKKQARKSGIQYTYPICLFGVALVCVGNPIYLTHPIVICFGIVHGL